MFIEGIVIGFTMDEGDELKPLVKECGYSKPERTERGVIARKDTYTHSAGVEIERLTNQSDKCFATIYINSAKDADEAVREVLKDLREVGLIAWSSE